MNAEIPKPTATEADVANWYKLTVQLSDLKQQEYFERMKVFRGFFHDPREGTNTHVLSDGYQLKAVNVVNRSIDVAAVTTNARMLAEMGVDLNKVIKWTPELVKSAYNELTEDQRKAFDNCLVVKEGTPQLEIKEPSKRASTNTPAGEHIGPPDVVVPEGSTEGQQTLDLGATTGPKKLKTKRKTAAKKKKS